MVTISLFYLVVAEFWVYNEHMAGGPQAALLVSSVAKVTVIGIVSGLHCDESEKAPVVRTAGAKRQFLCRVGGQNLTSVAAQTHTVMHDLRG